MGVTLVYMLLYCDTKTAEILLQLTDRHSIGMHITNPISHWQQTSRCHEAKS